MENTEIYHPFKKKKHKRAKEENETTIKTKLKKGKEKHFEDHNLNDSDQYSFTHKKKKKKHRRKENDNYQDGEYAKDNLNHVINLETEKHDKIKKGITKLLENVVDSSDSLQSPKTIRKKQRSKVEEEYGANAVNLICTPKKKKKLYKHRNIQLHLDTDFREGQIRLNAYNTGNGELNVSAAQGNNSKQVLTNESYASPASASNKKKSTEFNEFSKQLGGKFIIKYKVPKLHKDSVEQDLIIQQENDSNSDRRIAETLNRLIKTETEEHSKIKKRLGKMLESLGDSSDSLKSPERNTKKQQSKSKEECGENVVDPKGTPVKKKKKSHKRKIELQLDSDSQEGQIRLNVYNTGDSGLNLSETQKTNSTQALTDESYDSQTSTPNKKKNSESLVEKQKSHKRNDRTLVKTKKKSKNKLDSSDEGSPNTSEKQKNVQDKQTTLESFLVLKMKKECNKHDSSGTNGKKPSYVGSENEQIDSEPVKKKKLLSQADSESDSLLMRKKVKRELEDENLWVDYDSMMDIVELQSKRLSDEHTQMLQQLIIDIPWPVPPSHLIETRMSTHPSKFQQSQFKELGLDMKTDRYTSEEDNIIINNWNKFCELHNITNDPQPFLAFEAIRNTKVNGSVLPKMQRINFVRFLGHNLPNRCLFSVYRRFKKLCTVDKKGKFSSAEDSIILNFVNNSHDTNKFAQLAIILHRDRHAIMLRHKVLTKKYGENFSP